MLLVQHTADGGIEVGMDEAGRGCFWGPLYAGAVIWVPEADMSEEQATIAAQIKDSKKLSEKRRTVLSDAIKDLALAWGIGSVTAEEIDTLGMTKANQLAFTRALEKLDVIPERLIIDGVLSIYDQPWSMIEQVVEPEADGTYLSVAAASVLAKVAHDNWVYDYATANATVAQRYDLLGNKGYGTAKHREGIQEHGIHPLHRRLFLRKMAATETIRVAFEPNA